MTDNTTLTHHRPSRREVNQIGERAAELMAEIAERQAELDGLKLAMQAWPYDNYLAGDHVKIQVQAYRRRNDARFQDDHPFELHPELYKFVLDTAAIKNEIAPVDLEPYMEAQAPRVVIKPLEA